MFIPFIPPKIPNGSDFRPMPIEQGELRGCKQTSCEPKLRGTNLIVAVLDTARAKGMVCGSRPKSVDKQRCAIPPIPPIDIALG
jgi:hypothetical protein